MKLSRFTRAQTPTRAGRASSLAHVSGENPRKAKLTAMPGTNPRHPPSHIPGTGDLKSKGGSLAQHAAPYKHGGSFFDAEASFEGPGTGLPE